MRPEEEEIFLEMEREAIYPELSRKRFKQWMKDEDGYVPLTFVLEDDGKIIGGAVWEVQDHLDETQIVLQLDALFIKKERRRQELGRQLLRQSLAAADLYYHQQGLKVIGFLIQITSLNEGALIFYRKALEFPYSEVTQKMGEVEVTVLLVTIK